jgi:hypothetical protein
MGAAEVQKVQEVYRNTEDENEMNDRGTIKQQA